jgi:hypothetical protein
MKYLNRLRELLTAMGRPDERLSDQEVSNQMRNPTQLRYIVEIKNPF